MRDALEVFAVIFGAIVAVFVLIFVMLAISVSYDCSKYSQTTGIPTTSTMTTCFVTVDGKTMTYDEYKLSTFSAVRDVTIKKGE